MSFDKQNEELKRARHYDPEQRWKHLLETIAWVQANLPEEQRRNTKRACLEKQAKLLGYGRTPKH